MSHTPGPWRCDDSSVMVGRRIVANAYDPSDTQHLTDTAKANARLIAEAPAMLEALRETTNVLSIIMDVLRSEYTVIDSKHVYREEVERCIRSNRAITARTDGKP